MKWRVRVFQHWPCYSKSAHNTFKYDNQGAAITAYMVRVQKQLSGEATYARVQLENYFESANKWFVVAASDLNARISWDE